MEDKKEVLVLCCTCEHAKVDMKEEWVFNLLCRVDGDKPCMIGPHECGMYKEDVIPF